MLARVHDATMTTEDSLSRERERAGVRVSRARALRQKSTDAESVLWRRLRARQLADARFRRQHPVGDYIVDFACVQKRLAVELDGGQHAQQDALSYDTRRTEYLKSEGWRVLRFWNHDVMGNLEGVLEAILCVLQESTLPSPQPSPASGRGSGSARN